MGANGNVYVSGQSSNNVFEITPGGAITEILDATGDGLGGTVQSPEWLAVGPSGNVYASCFGTDNAFEITPGGTVTEIIDATGDGLGNALDGGEGIATDAAGNVYVSGWSSHNLFQITPGGVVTEILENSIAPGSGLVGGRGVAVDANGVVYVCGFYTDNAHKVELPVPQVGTSTCTSTPNSTGVAATIAGFGTASIGANDLTLVAGRPPEPARDLHRGPWRDPDPAVQRLLVRVAPGLAALRDREHALGRLAQRGGRLPDLRRGWPQRRGGRELLLPALEPRPGGRWGKRELHGRARGRAHALRGGATPGRAGGRASENRELARLLEVGRAPCR